MSEERSIGQRWSEFRPSKGQWFWSCAGVAATVIVVGFAFGGWVLGSSADEMAENAADEARNDLIATLCVGNFAQSANASVELAAIKDASSWERDNLVEDGGWAKIQGIEGTSSGAVDMCAERLANFTLPAAKEASSSATKGG